MNTIYKNKSSKAAVFELYDNQLKKLEIPFEDIEVETSFGKSHLVKIGNSNGKPLLVFHGGNATSAYNLLACKFLFDDFNIYAVDTIGHPGKSAEVCLSPRNYDYGKWASEIISKLGFEKMLCFGGSYGAGVLAKMMCIAPQKIERAVLLVPSGINNSIPISTMKMLIPMFGYLFTGKKEWLIKTILPMAITQDVIDDDIFDMAKNSFDCAKTKIGMPSNVSAKLMKNYSSPALVIAAEKDCLFPARRVLPKAKKIIKSCDTYLLKNRGHMHVLSQEEKAMIVDFLDK